MNGYPQGAPTEVEPPRKRRHRFRRFFRLLTLIVVCLAIAFVAMRFGPDLYRRLFGNGNTTWISERFGEELKAQNELVVSQVTLTGQETAQKDAWLIGKVQEVLVPYSFSISFVVDLGRASVSVSDAGDVITVRLPSPVAKYPKLTVDEDNMKKYDLLYPLTPERYAEIKTEIEQKLIAECQTKEAYLEAAWNSAVKNMETLFKSIAERSEQGVTCEIQVLRDDRLAEPDASQSPLPEVTAGAA